MTYPLACWPGCASTSMLAPLRSPTYNLECLADIQVRPTRRKALEYLLS